MREKKKTSMAVFRMSEQLSRAVDLHADRVGITRTVLFTRAVLSYLLDADTQYCFEQIGDSLGLMEKSALFAQRYLADEIGKEELDKIYALTEKAICAASASDAANAAAREAERMRKLTAKAIDAANAADAANAVAREAERMRKLTAKAIDDANVEG